MLRRSKKLGRARTTVRLNMPASVHRVLVRRHPNRLAWLDRPTTDQVIRRYEHQRPRDMVHVDIKKLGPIPPGGG